MNIPNSILLLLCQTLSITIIYLSNKVTPAKASAYRGGSIYWRPISPPSSTRKTIEIIYRLTWDKKSVPKDFCKISPFITQDGEIGNFRDFIVCNAGCNGLRTIFEIDCKEESVIDGWITSQGKFNYTFPKNSQYFELGFKGCCWIPSKQSKNSPWSLITSGNVKVREDTGLVNSPPVPVNSPYLKLEKGCSHKFKINSYDEDGDEVRCRLNIPNKSCGESCQAQPSIIIDEYTCEIKVIALGEDNLSGIYYTDVILEDFAPSALSIRSQVHKNKRELPLSRTTVQMIIEIYDSEFTTCTLEDLTYQPSLAALSDFNPTLNSSKKKNFNWGYQPRNKVRRDGLFERVPVNPPTTSNNVECIDVPLSITFQGTIYVRSPTPDFFVQNIFTVSPTGLVSSSVFKVSDNPPLYGQNVTWSPTDGQKGPNSFCFFAVNSVGQRSATSCLTLYVTESKENVGGCGKRPQVICTNNGLEVSLQVDDPKFNNGIFYVKNYFKQPGCQLMLPPSGRSEARLRVPLGACGLQLNPETMRYETIVILQPHSMLVTNMAKAYHVICQPAQTMVEIPVRNKADVNMITTESTLRQTHIPPTPTMIFTDENGQPLNRASLGQKIRIGIFLPNQNNYDMKVKSCVARARESTWQFELIDSQGCPTDTRIFPQFESISRGALIANFPAFKFPDSEYIQLECVITVCWRQCPPQLNPVCSQPYSSVKGPSNGNNNSAFTFRKVPGQVRVLSPGFVLDENGRQRRKIPNTSSPIFKSLNKKQLNDNKPFSQPFYKYVGIRDPSHNFNVFDHKDSESLYRYSNEDQADDGLSPEKILPLTLKSPLNSSTNVLRFIHKRTISPGVTEFKVNASRKIGLTKNDNKKVSDLKISTKYLEIFNKDKEEEQEPTRNETSSFLLKDRLIQEDIKLPNQRVLYETSDRIRFYSSGTDKPPVKNGAVCLGFGHRYSSKSKTMAFLLSGLMAFSSAIIALLTYIYLQRQNYSPLAKRHYKNTGNLSNRASSADSIIS